MEVIFAHSKIEKFIRSLEKSVISETIRVIDLLHVMGPELREPDSKALGKGLFELRIIDHVRIRIVYIFSGDQIVLLHAFMKKTERISKNDLTRARDRQRAWKRAG